MAKIGMLSTADFSSNRRQRFSLFRDWRTDFTKPARLLMVVMLNPSKADEDTDDPTVRKVIGFAKRWGYDAIVILNLNPNVSTDPFQLVRTTSKIANFNRLLWRYWAAQAESVLVAWGAPPKDVRETIGFTELVKSFYQNVKGPMFCIGMTKEGFPKHPSRAAYTDEPDLFRCRSYA